MLQGSGERGGEREKEREREKEDRDRQRDRQRELTAAPRNACQRSRICRQQHSPALTPFAPASRRPRLIIMLLVAKRALPKRAKQTPGVLFDRRPRSTSGPDASIFPGKSSSMLCMCTDGSPIRGPVFYVAQQAARPDVPQVWCVAMLNLKASTSMPSRQHNKQRS